MPLTFYQYKEALEHLLTNGLELKSKYPNQKNLMHNDCEYIEDLVNITDTDIPNLCYQTPTKALKYLSIGHHNLIWIFIS